MSEVPSAGWREVYEWAHVEAPDRGAELVADGGRVGEAVD